jgi:hypothetical protein
VVEAGAAVNRIRQIMLLAEFGITRPQPCSPHPKGTWRIVDQATNENDGGWLHKTHDRVAPRRH